jgi:hypothetical protein
MQDHEHPNATKRSGYRYLFTAKHHGGGPEDSAAWLKSVTETEEFSIFDESDSFDLSDSKKNLFGVLRDTDGSLRDIGTWYQQVAQFPVTDAGQPWHGYPVWAVFPAAPSRLNRERCRPSKLVFEKMQVAGVITRRQRRRLVKGDHA